MNPSDRPPDNSLDTAALIEKTSFGAYLLYFGAFLALALIGGLSVAAVGYHAGVFVYQFVAILGAAILYRQLTGDRANPWPSFDDTGVDVTTLVIVLVTVVLLGLVGNIAMGLLVEYFPGLEDNATAYSERIRRLLLQAEGLNYWLGMTGVCVTAPIVEEALFRGTILQEQRKANRGIWTLALLNGALFALFHVEPLLMPSLVLLGTFLAYITLISESLLLPILAHAVVNTANGVVLPQLFAADTTAGPVESASLPQLWTWFAGLAAAAALGWWLIARQRSA